MVQLNKKDKLYYARILPQVGIYEVCEIVVRTITDTWFAGIDKRDKRAHLFSNNDIGKIIFHEREMALEKAFEAESNAPKNTCETESYEKY